MIRYRSFVLLFLLGLGVVGYAGLAQSSPGYMDAEYYLMGGQRLAGGHGFTEPIVWNYLGGEVVLPAPGAPDLDHPSHAYWMPLASMLAAIGIILTGPMSFRAAQVGFVLVAALIPPLTAALAGSILRSHLDPAEVRRLSIFAGLLALFPGFYLAYLPTTDTFGIYMLLGGLWFLIVPGCSGPMAPLRLFILGVLAGAMHLARADGLIWLGLGLIAVLLEARTRKIPPLKAAFFLSLVLAGYLFIFGPWMLRNLWTLGAPLAPGGVRALWLTHYDELYAYPAEKLTAARWWASGFKAIYTARLDSLWTNLQSTLAVQGQVYLLPLVFWGGWRLRFDRRTWLAAGAWLLTLAAMSMAFPFAGARGGFFHSGAALQPLVWVFAAVGLEGFVAWGQRRRGWRPRQARWVFSTGLVLLGLGMSVFIFNQRVIGGDRSSPAWDASYERYVRLESALQEHQPLPEDIVLVNNPPGYFLASGRQAAAIPYGDEAAVATVAERLGARYLLLEIDQVPGSTLYTQPGDRPALRYLGSTLEEVRIYEFTGQK